MEGRGTPCKLIAFIVRRERRDLGSGPPFLEGADWRLGVEFAEASFAWRFLGFFGARGTKATTFAVVGVAVAVVDEDGEKQAHDDQSDHTQTNSQCNDQMLFVQSGIIVLIMVCLRCR